MAYSSILKVRIDGLDDLKKGANEVLKTKKFTPKNGNPANNEILNIAVKGIIVTAFSEIEIYLEDFITSWFELSINGKAHKNIFKSKVPKFTSTLLVKEKVREHFYRYFLNNDETALIEKLSIEFIDRFSNLDQPNSFSVKSILGRIKYPSPKNLNLLCKRIGISNVFDEMGKIKASAWEEKLTSLNDIRTGLVHRGELPKNFGPKDAVKYITDVKAVLITLEKVLKKHLNKSLTVSQRKKLVKENSLITF